MIFQRRCLLLTVFICAYSITFFTSCEGQHYSSPEGYDLNNPKVMELGKVLVEISGISYNDSKDGTLFGISDSKRNIFEINYKKQKLKDFTDKVVPPDSDLEDILALDSSIYLLSSRGTIFEVPLTSKDSSGVIPYSLNLQGQNDFETIYYDPTADGIIMVCKTCAFEKGNHSRSAFRFDLKTKSFDTTAFYSINTEEVKKLMKDNDAKFDPSAAAISPINKRLFILSSAGNLLIVTDTRGKIIEGYKLNPDKFPQAEGIAFAPNGDMYISNEGKYNKPTLMIIPYGEQKKKKSDK